MSDPHDSDGPGEQPGSDHDTDDPGADALPSGAGPQAEGEQSDISSGG